MENEGNEESKLEKFKKHLKENWKVYVGTSAGVITGAAAMAVFLTKKYGMTDAEMFDRYQTEFVAMIKGNRNTQNVTYQTVSIYGNKIGRPGIPVIDTTTGKEYKSITLASEATGIDKNRIRNQIQGRAEHVNGHKFALSEAMAE